MSAARDRSAPRSKPAKPAKAGQRARSAASTRPASRPGSRFWLVKTDAASYSIADLQRDGVTPWTGVRNYQARNTLRDDMKPGDRVLVYHSSSDPLVVAGVAEVASLPRPDETAFKKGDDHYDPDSDPSDPTWWLVDLRHLETFPSPVTRERLALEPRLRRMVLLQRGSRLSVQPVTPEEFATVLELAHGAGGRRKRP